MRPLHFRICIFCAAACLLGASSGHAALLFVGGPFYPAPSEADLPVGDSLASIAVPFSAAPLHSDMLTSEIYDSESSNLYGGMTSVDEWSNDLVSLDAIHRLTINNFSDLLVDASYRAPTAGLPQSRIDRSAARTVRLGFLTLALGPNDRTPRVATASLVLRTNAASYVPSSASAINGIESGAVSFSPPPLLPQPASILMLAIGAGGLCLCGHRWRPRRARRPSELLRLG